ncbi:MULTISPECIES: hypothetical protein [unclassified Polaromonas]|jgi:hypothetical protein|uniref:hypothetical protein n=1 Tax=unclassified Polaromonas TaxID=2638319 RepID=UPI0025CD94E7|nr:MULTISPECIES: hypothetical protein [unclassified Polaromonas]HQR98118.1 hypothetical protein [Polaromonas sp.]HQS38824.1 hypothetical protein [Polaromonas sp.]HQS88078.1 hypothetical protein [Polaromonas sp.]
MTCNACPNPANCSPTFCHFEQAELETPQDIAARHFWEPNQALHIDVYTGPSRLHRVLDWVGNLWDKLNELGKICTAVFGVALCFAAAVAAVEAMT